MMLQRSAAEAWLNCLGPRGVSAAKHVELTGWAKRAKQREVPETRSPAAIEMGPPQTSEEPGSTEGRCERFLLGPDLHVPE